MGPTWCLAGHPRTRRLVDGLVLWPGRVYLGTTAEVIGSDVLVPSLIGRSSLGRLWVFLHFSADLGQVLSCSWWRALLRSRGRGRRLHW
ncbi:hypothetical protein ACFVTP_08960 [Streptomyces celluloflavus]|uniref:dCTP deaminase domain-containing protein n=1 Tax=Streptomyces celluloflavus TaxID=58344 RepID=UPI0036DCF4C6